MKELKTEVEFQEIIQKGTVLIDFFATWCGPCKMLAPELEKLESAEVIKVDVDKFPNLTKEYNIMGVPTLLLFKNGQLVSRKSGYMTQEMLEEWIHSVIA